MNLIECVREAWAWTGLEPVEVLDQNEFGNLLVRDDTERVWWIRPEQLSCEVVAENEDTYDRLRRDPEFSLSWEMKALVTRARRHVGALEAGRSYCLKMPATLGGPFDESNFAALDTVMLVGVSGDIARQIQDLPDGAVVEIKIVD